MRTDYNLQGRATQPSCSRCHAAGAGARSWPGKVQAEVRAARQRHLRRATRPATANTFRCNEATESEPHYERVHAHPDRIGQVRRMPRTHALSTGIEALSALKKPNVDRTAAIQRSGPQRRRADGAAGHPPIAACARPGRHRCAGGDAASRAMSLYVRDRVEVFHHRRLAVYLR